MNKLQHYWNELQRRHVVKAGLAYLVGAWLLVQVLDILLDAFQLGPGWMQTTIIALSVGFPIWLIIAWIYDFTPQGLKKTDEVPFDPEISRKKDIGLNRFIIGGLGIAVILLVANTFRLTGQVDALEEDYLSMDFKASMAVLPLEDLSPKKDQRYISDGLSRSIYTELSRIKDLKLISPTSSFQYRDRDVGIEVIAEELGVRYILEGSAQLIKGRFRADINLVDTEDNSVIWSKDFQLEVEDVYGVYEEVARNVGSYLNVTLEAKDVRIKKVDPEAYLLYLKAEDTSTYFREEPILAADSLIRRSIKIDPTYAPSQITLSKITLHKGIYYGYYPYKEAIRIGKQAAFRAIELDSTYQPAYGWLANWQWHDKDSKAALRNYEREISMGVNAQMLNSVSHQKMRENKLKKSLELSRKGIELDPKNRDLYMNSFMIELMLEEPELALMDFDRFMELDKSKYAHNAIKASIINAMGDHERALDLVHMESEDYWRYWYGARILHDLGRIEESEQEIANLVHFPVDQLPGMAWPDFDLAVVYAYTGQNDKAFEHLNNAYDELLPNLEYFFTTYEFKKLYDDPRWDEYIDRLSEEFSYDFPHRPE